MRPPLCSRRDTVLCRHPELWKKDTDHQCAWPFRLQSTPHNVPEALLARRNFRLTARTGQWATIGKHRQPFGRFMGLGMAPFRIKVNNLTVGSRRCRLSAVLYTDAPDGGKLLQHCPFLQCGRDTSPSRGRRCSARRLSCARQRASTYRWLVEDC